MKIIRDELADTVWIQLTEDDEKFPYSHSLEITDDVIFDVDHEGNLIGIQIMDYSHVMKGK